MITLKMSNLDYMYVTKNENGKYTVEYNSKGYNITIPNAEIEYTTGNMLVHAYDENGTIFNCINIDEH